MALGAREAAAIEIALTCVRPNKYKTAKEIQGQINNAGKGSHLTKCWNQQKTHIQIFSRPILGFCPKRLFIFFSKKSFFGKKKLGLGKMGV